MECFNNTIILIIINKNIRNKGKSREFLLKVLEKFNFLICVFNSFLKIMDSFQKNFS